MTGDRHLDPSAMGDHIDRLYRAAWSLCGSREDAEDLVQETFARVLRKPRILRSEDDLAYLLRVLHNTFLSQRRAAARRPQTTAPLERMDFEDPTSAQPQLGLEAREIYAEVAALPRDFRDVVVAVDVLGLSYAEAAHALRVREATVTSRLYRARQRVARAVAADKPVRRSGRRHTGDR